MNIVLIPKVKNSRTVSDFWSISLFNVIYKLVTKAMVSRLKEIMGSIISVNQSVFVMRSLIRDNIIVCHECLSFINRRGRGKVGLCSRAKLMIE